jgi:group I intron endonuclease
MIGIYKITSPTGKIYIGQSINIPERLRQYKNEKCIAQPKLYNSIKKHGFDTHTVEVLHECLVSDLNRLECYYIDLYRSFGSKHGMNLRSGGGANHKCSEETKDKIRKKRQLQTFSEETRKKLSDIARNRSKEDNKRIWGGKSVSDETRRKLSISSTGRKHRPETIEKMSMVQKGKKVSDLAKQNMKNAKQNISKETRFKMSLARKGKKLSKQAAINIGVGHYKPIMQYTKDGEFVRMYVSTIHASIDIGTSRANISGVLQGRHKTAGGFIWKKFENA